jgi:hypothetical protein
MVPLRQREALQRRHAAHQAAVGDAEWDESQVHRGGNPANRGQFSKGGGSGSEPPKAEPARTASAPTSGERRYETPLGRVPKGIPMKLHQALGDYDFRYKGITDEGVRYENAKTGDILRFRRDADQKATGIWQFQPKEGRSVSGDGDMWETILKEERPEYRELANRRAEYEPKPREGGLDPQKSTRESLETLFQQYREKRMTAAQKTDPSGQDYPEQIEAYNREMEPVTRAVQQKMAETVGQAMGVDPKRVYFSGEHPTAKVGDRSFNVGGMAYHASGKIEMFGVDRPGMNAAGTLAHEMMHVKFESIRQRRNDEYRAWIEASKNEDWSLPQEDRLMTGAGYMTEKGKREYPLVADWEATMSQPGQWQKLMDDDGITDYSREWWQAFHDKKANGDQATHETLAEMAKLDLEGSLDRLLWFKESTSWKPLYELVNKHYSASADDREHSATKQLAT